jgi:ABC-2 type transport system permease protein
MIVVADGDVIQNRTRRGQIVPLGEDRYTGQVFGNKSFIMNCVDYLCDDSGIMELRSREIRLRLLDRARLQEERTQWQLVSVLLPIIILSVFGLSKMLIRKHRYHKMR